MDSEIIKPLIIKILYFLHISHGHVQIFLGQGKKITTLL